MLKEKERKNYSFSFWQKFFLLSDQRKKMNREKIFDKSEIGSNSKKPEMAFKWLEWKREWWWWWCWKFGFRQFQSSSIWDGLGVFCSCLFYFCEWTGGGQFHHHHQHHHHKNKWMNRSQPRKWHCTKKILCETHITNLVRNGFNGKSKLYFPWNGEQRKKKKTS